MSVTVVRSLTLYIRETFVYNARIVAKKSPKCGHVYSVFGGGNFWGQRTFEVVGAAAYVNMHMVK